MQKRKAAKLHTDQMIVNTKWPLKEAQNDKKDQQMINNYPSQAKKNRLSEYQILVSNND